MLRRLYIDIRKTSPFKSFHHHYSTNSPIAAEAAQPQNRPQLEDCLVNSLGFSAEAALSFSKRLQSCRSKCITKDPSSVVSFFHDLGLSNSHIKSIISTHPRLLLSDVDKTLKPKVRFLQEFGFQGQDLVRVLVNYKSLLGTGLDTQIQPSIECLRKHLGDDDKVLKAVKRCPSLLHKQSVRRVEENAQLFRSIGYSDEYISRFIIKLPRIFIQKDAKYFEVLFGRVENELGIPRHSNMFFHGVVHLASFTKSSIAEKVQVFRSFGWSDEAIRDVMRKFPTAMSISIEKLRGCLNFYMKEHGCTPKVLATDPVLLCLNLEKVKMRNQVIEVLSKMGCIQKKTSPSVFRLRESKFLEKFLLPYKEKIPHVYKSYMEKVGKEMA